MARLEKGAKRGWLGPPLDPPPLGTDKWLEAFTTWSFGFAVALAITVSCALVRRRKSRGWMLCCVFKVFSCAIVHKAWWNCHARFVTDLIESEIEPSAQVK